ncbi:hypothetical protein PIROE2DRAFT_16473 [Piromyces sp. E2]|nr:hypothetical protein PIROE2DRAFT_16473 [Piromyces sp. E2]|eukprot:OUM58289.1 hypothetical protein PIROE2DRAFT_16473 [Piromyces sp. E2]
MDGNRNIDIIHIDDALREDINGLYEWKVRYNSSHDIYPTLNDHGERDENSIIIQEDPFVMNVMNMNIYPGGYYRNVNDFNENNSFAIGLYLSNANKKPNQSAIENGDIKYNQGSFPYFGNIKSEEGFDNFTTFETLENNNYLDDNENIRIGVYIRIYNQGTLVLKSIKLMKFYTL